MRRLVLKEGRNQCPPQPGQVVIIGVDLSRSKWVYACRWGGQERRRFGSAGELKHLQAVVREYQDRGCEVHVVYEACGFGYEIAWWLEEHKARVIVVPPSTVERAPGAQVKTDRLDAGSLAAKSEGLLIGDVQAGGAATAARWRQLAPRCPDSERSAALASKRQYCGFGWLEDRSGVFEGRDFLG
jgi:hypothetical protein